MSKAEERAKETYPLRDAEHVYDEERVIEAREYFVQGYHQAEKDLELTWEDMAFIRVAFDALEANIHLGAIKIQPMTKEYYEEVLKQFKNLKK